MADSSFPYLNEHEYFRFPSLDTALEEGIVAVGGNLSPGMLLSAYKQGIFPWYSKGEPIYWWSPDPRCVLIPGNVHVSLSMERIFKKELFHVTLDTAFEEVVTACQTIPRRHENGTWITDEMLKAYCRLYELGFGHSIEVWKDKELIGGLYGLSLGRAFFGESMFSLKPNGSKIAMIELARFLSARDFLMLDCQVYNHHLGSMGAVNIPRKEYMRLLKEALGAPTLGGRWTEMLYPS